MSGQSRILFNRHARRYVPTADPYVQRLRQLSYSPVTWFRNPCVQLVIFSCEDGEEYRRVHRPQLKAIADPDARIPIAPELVIAYISPPGSDPRLTAKVWRPGWLYEPALHSVWCCSICGWCLARCA